MKIIKGGELQNQNANISQDDLDKINTLTHRAFSADELFSFNVALCDNEIDRDFERFDDVALEELKILFLGKTGICDHNPKAENQQARIYETNINQKTGETTSFGAPYKVLEAKAYMIRTDGNKDLILEIEGGIKKEVSVGCSMKEAICSVCGVERNTSDCGHKAGNYIGGKVCHTILKKPLDAYEWSFVAVPAQKNAGVIKDFLGNKELEKNIFKALEAGQPVQLTAWQAGELSHKIKQMHDDCLLVRRQLYKKALAAADITGDTQNLEYFNSALEKMSIPEIKTLCLTLESKNNAPKMQRKLDLPQIEMKNNSEATGDKSFII